ncbi:MAG: hypothetical protein RIR12_636 [Bacteroidota bacterium]|jgi:regulator of sirC expression with transglutaminase-like and TPR domain
METNREINALLTLLDDPDEEIFCVVSEKIVHYGSPIIPNLEHLWETTADEHTQNRIELLIHRLHYNDLTDDFQQWGLAGHHDLTLGALLTAKFQYAEMATAPVLQEIEKIRRNIWLEINNYQTPLEQINIISSILYSYFGLKGGETNYELPNQFFIHKTLEAKKGNQISNGIIYLIVCELLDIPVKAIQIPKQFVLAHFKPTYGDEKLVNAQSKIDFFIDPTAGHIFSQQDVDAYFKRISVPQVGSYFKPQNNKQVIQSLLEELAKCFTADRELYKQIELRNLSRLLD